MTVPRTPDDDMAAIVSACDEALAEGGLPDIDCGDGVSPDQARLLKGLACVRLLRDVWPHTDSTLRPQPQTIIGQAEEPRQVGRFQILRELGRGGFGIVYLAFDPQLDRNVALKIPRPDVVSTEQLRERFRKEARAAAALDHPNVVAVHETGECDGVSYIAAAYCPGQTLANCLESRSENIPFAKVADWLAQLADGVQHAHDRDILHRDLKPANVMLVAADGGASTPKITDFGLARTLDAADGDGLTMTGAILGTPSYLAPEQTDHKFHSVGPAADIYGLGAILYEALTRRPPFQSDSTLETLRQVRSDEPISPRRLRSQVPRDLETICLKCLEKVPARRYVTARELAEDLRRFLAGETIRARPPGRLERTARWVKRRPAISILLATVMFLVATGVPGLAILWRRAANDRDQAAKDRDQAAIDRDRVATERDRAEANFAGRSIALARAAWMSEDYDMARSALADCPPALRNAEWDYLRRVCHAEQRTLIGQSWSVDTVAFSPDNRTLATLTAGGELRFWDVEKGESKRPYRMVCHRSSALVFTPDGQSVIVLGRTVLASALSPISAVELNIATGAQRQLWKSPSGAISAALSPTGDRVVWTVSETNAVELAELATGKVLSTLPIPARGKVFGHRFSPDGKRVATSVTVGNGTKGSIVIWNAATGEKVRQFERINYVAWGEFRFSPDGRRIAITNQSPDRACEILLGDLESGAIVKRLDCKLDQIYFTEFSPDGRYLAVASNADRIAKVWDIEADREYLTLRGHNRVLLSLAFSPDGKTLATGSEDHTARLWQVGARD